MFNVAVKRSIYLIIHARRNFIHYGKEKSPARVRAGDRSISIYLKIFYWVRILACR